MKPHIDIVILDIDCYLVLGMKSVLTQHFIRKGWSVRFLSSKHQTNANLVILSGGMNRMARHCRYGTAYRRQHVITIQETTQPRMIRSHIPACLSEQIRITRKVTKQNLLAEVERALETGNPHSPQDCPRCKLTLTHREYLVLSAIHRCMRLYQVAAFLNLSIKTVSRHKCNAMKKLGFHRNSELYNWLRQGGLEQEIRL